MAYKIFVKCDESVPESRMDYSLSPYTKCGPHASKSRRVKYSRNKNLVHHNLNPENILVKCNESGPKRLLVSPLKEYICISIVSDFGAMKEKIGSVVSANQTTNIGSTMFIAPEIHVL
jgi:serine/threonine protein kinase